MWILEIWENTSKENWYLCLGNWFVPQHLVPCVAFRCCWLHWLGFSWLHWELRHLAYICGHQVCAVSSETLSAGIVLQYFCWPPAALQVDMGLLWILYPVCQISLSTSTLSIPEVAHGTVCEQLKPTSWSFYQLFPNRETFQCYPQDLNHEQRISLLKRANSDLCLISSTNKSHKESPREEKEWWTDTVGWSFLLHAFRVGAVAVPQKHSFCKDPVRYRGNTEL